jgi:RNA polymerase sigma-70 factor (ECF subfamily)
MTASSETSGSTSLSLLQKAKDRNPEAWQRLVTLYSPVVYRWVRKSGVKSQDAADVVQEVFRAVSRSIGCFRRESAADGFRKWLWAITRTKVRDHYRRHYSQPAAEGGTVAHERINQIPVAPPAEEDEAAMSNRLARRALDLMETDFEPSTWQAFWLTAIENHRPADVADDLEMTVAAVYQAKSRVLRRLRQELSGLIDPE